MVKVYKLLIIALSLLPLYVFADITVAPVFTDNMVIQQEKPVYVWGKAPAGEKIKISFMSQRYSTVADANGEWIAVLKAVSATKKTAKTCGKFKVRKNCAKQYSCWRSVARLRTVKHGIFHEQPPAPCPPKERRPGGAV